MWDFLRAMFLSKVLLLTPAPADVEGQFILQMKEPLEAVTTGARIEIDVSNVVGFSGTSERRWDKLTPILRTKIPEGSVEGSLIGADGMLLRLEDGGFSMSSDDIRLALVARGGVPLHTGFVTLKLTSAVPLRSIKIYWRNYYE